MKKKIFADTDFQHLEPKQKVSICFEVEVPKNINHQKGVHITGNLEVLGGWNPRGKALKKISSTLYRREFEIFKGTLVFYKFTQGDWKTVEVNEKGFDVSDRSLQATEDTKVKIKVHQFAQRGAKTIPSTKDEHVEDLGHFGQKIMGGPQFIQVHVPPSYLENPRPLPVMYMLDGQNLFDASIAFMGQEWAADKVYDKLEKEGRVRPFFIVAFHHAHQRDQFYTPVPDRYLGGAGGKLHLLDRTIREEIEPALKEKYQILTDPDHRGIAGSSLGGLAAFHMGWRYPDQYRVIGAISPSFWWANYYTYNMILKDRTKTRPLKIWMDMGTRESQYRHRPIIAVSKVAYLLKRKGYNVKLYMDKNGTHSERSWRGRLPEIFSWLMSPDEAGENAAG